jgi:hypothetical protein
MAFKLFTRGLARRRTRNNHVVAGGELVAVVAEDLAQGALDPVAADGPRIDLSRHCQTQPWRRRHGVPMHGQPWRRLAAAVLEDAVEIRTRAYPRAAREAGGIRGHAAAGVTRAAVGESTGVTGLARTGRSGLRLGAKTLAALGATAREDLAAIGRRHAGTETVVALALEVAGLVGALGGHGRLGVNDGKDRGF